MNKKDESILRILGRKAGLSSRALSKMLDIPISTVHRRVKRLERDGIIVGYKAVINFEKTTHPIGSLLLINLSEVITGKGHIPKKEVLNTLKHYNEIEEIIEVQAAYFDLVVKARFQSLKKLSAFIEDLRHIEGIEETSSAIITDETIMPPPRFID
jgi:DNA-binding Lrp family transcriptional regulator